MTKTQLAFYYIVSALLSAMQKLRTDNGDGDFVLKPDARIRDGYRYPMN